MHKRLDLKHTENLRTIFLKTGKRWSNIQQELNQKLVDGRDI